MKAKNALIWGFLGVTKRMFLSVNTRTGISHKMNFNYNGSFGLVFFLSLEMETESNAASCFKMCDQPAARAYVCWSLQDWKPWQA